MMFGAKQANLILLGAWATKLLEEGQRDKAREALLDLSSEVTQEWADYLLMRVEATSRGER